MTQSWFNDRGNRPRTWAYSARALARQGVVVTLVLTLALGITASLALAALERSPS